MQIVTRSVKLALPVTIVQKVQFIQFSALQATIVLKIPFLVQIYHVLVELTLVHFLWNLNPNAKLAHQVFTVLKRPLSQKHALLAHRTQVMGQQVFPHAPVARKENHVLTMD